MNAIELLKEDHQLAISLIDELETADDQAGTDPVQTENFNKLHQALIVHTRMEEEVFYPALENLDETQEMIKEAHQEHEKVDQIAMAIWVSDLESNNFLERGQGYSLSPVNCSLYAKGCLLHSMDN